MSLNVLAHFRSRKQDQYVYLLKVDRKSTVALNDLYTDLLTAYTTLSDGNSAHE